jgi:NADH dehydrogenase
VTGAYGYSGRYIARRLLDEGHRVTTLTNSRHVEDPFGGRVSAVPLSFDHGAALVESLRGVDVLYNTYGVRFDHRRFSNAGAVENTLRPFAAAREAGVRRIVNNIAWMLRRFPVFALPGDGSYRLQPIYADDLAALAVSLGGEEEDRVVDAIGPDTFTYRELVETIAHCIGRRRPLIPLPPFVVHGLGAAMGAALGDVVITRDEIRGLMEERLYVESPPAGSTRLGDWARAHADRVGARYANELARRAPGGGG